MVQQDQWLSIVLGHDTGLIAQYSGLSVWCCHNCSIGHNCGSDIIPGLGPPFAWGWGEGTKKDKKKKSVSQRRAPFCRKGPVLVHVAHQSLAKSSWGGTVWVLKQWWIQRMSTFSPHAPAAGDPTGVCSWTLHAKFAQFYYKC